MPRNLSSRRVFLILAFVASLILFTATLFFSSSSQSKLGRRQRHIHRDELKQQEEEDDIDDDETAIDAVYTWVNGSDELHARARRRFNEEVTANATSKNTTNDDDDRAAVSRFADHEELRYSMRSLERFAPWVRRVYLVTNGQVPHWLNLAHPRVRVVSHLDIFSNRSHLPVFSSSAIETHLHRIPGLSRRFLYLNDDTFFGAPVVPDDFLCPVAGHKVFLSWEIPHCAPGCPWTHLSDSYCDLSSGCNVSECLFDGGDCLGANAHRLHGTNNNYFSSTSQSMPVPTHDSQGRLLCAPGCRNEDLQDPLCDLQTCGKSSACAFDNGFCGVDLLATLPQAEVDHEEEAASEAEFENSTSSLITVFVPTRDALAVVVNFTAIPQLQRFLSRTLQHAWFSIAEEVMNSGSSSTNSNVIEDGCSRIRTATFSRSASSFVITLFHNTTAAHGACLISFNFSSNALLHLNVSFARMFNDNNSSAPTENHTTATSVESAWTTIPVSITAAATAHHEKPDQREQEQPEEAAEPLNKPDRELLDTFGDSLRRSNLLLIDAFGGMRTLRKAPAHMVHLIERRIVDRLWTLFPAAFNATSQSRFRSGIHDIQYGFLHFYYMMHAQREPDAKTFFAEQMDLDGSGVLDPHEVRRVALLLHEKKVPLERLLEFVVEINEAGDVVLFENSTDSSNNSNNSSNDTAVPSETTTTSGNYRRSRTRSRSRSRSRSRDIDDESHLPTTTTGPLLPEEQVVPLSAEYLGIVERLIRQAQMGIKAELCEDNAATSSGGLTAEQFEHSQLAALVLPQYVEPEYRYELQTLDDVTFFMLRDNETLVRHQLDHVLWKRPKFFCLNDNLNPQRPRSYRRICDMLHDFFETYFPTPSSFEKSSSNTAASPTVRYIWQAPRQYYFFRGNSEDEIVSERALARALQHGYTLSEFEAERERFIRDLNAELRASVSLHDQEHHSAAAAAVVEKAVDNLLSVPPHVLLGLVGWLLLVVLLFVLVIIASS